MAQRSPGFENLTPTILQESVAGLRAFGVTQQSALELGLAQSIIINSLGSDFWAKECTTFGQKQAFFTQKNDVRIVHLANMLWCLKDCHGFRDFIIKNDMNDFESTYYECTAAHWFYKNSNLIELVIPKHVRGADFDILVQGFFAVGDLNVEVKARRKIFRSEKQALDFLKSHRTQLPSNGTGVIFCKLELGNGTITQDQLISTTRQFLASTTRVRFVIFCWDCSTIENAIALRYFSVDSQGRMKPIFTSEQQPVVLEFVHAAGL